MKKQFFAFAILALFSLVLVSAGDISISTPATLSKSVNSTSFTISNNNATIAQDISISTLINITDGTGKTITFIVNPISFNLQNLTSQTINADASIIPAGFKLGRYTTNIFASVDTMPENNATADLTFDNGFCDFGQNGSVLSLTRISDEQLDNKDEWDWAPLDNVEIEVKVQNIGDDDLDVVVEYGLYNPNTRDFVDLNEDTIDLSIDSGKSETATINFQIPSDIDERSDYQFYVKAYEDGREKAKCVDTKDAELYQQVQINKETNAVILDDIRVDSDYLCGDTVEFKADLVNIGNKDEDVVLVTLVNRELGVDMSKVIENLDSGDSETITFSFELPQDLAEKTYTLEAIIFYKYDDNNNGCSNDDDADCYDRNSLDDLDKTFRTSFSVEGCTIPVTSNAAISALLQTSDSDVKEGKTIQIKATVTNTGNARTVYIIDVSGEESFSSVSSIEPTTLIIESGQSQDVLITMKLNDDSAGEHVFNIKALFDGKEVTRQVSLSVTDSQTGIGNIFSNIKSNWVIWLIVLINIILIIAIIIVVVRLVRA